MENENRLEGIRRDIHKGNLTLRLTWDKEIDESFEFEVYDILEGGILKIIKSDGTVNFYPRGVWRTFSYKKD